MKFNIKMALMIMLVPLCLVGQDSFKESLKFKKQNFSEIVNSSNDYFSKKYPNKKGTELSIGESRDGEYVKFMRWQSFWKNRLTKEGNLANIAAHNLRRLEEEGGARDSAYDFIQWDNISYTADLGVQIGMGRTNSIAFHPTNVNIFYVAAANGGIWKTIDGGQTYTPIGDELPYLAVSSIVVDQNNPSVIYISISDRVFYGPASIGVYKSTDGGNTWNPTALSFEFTDQNQILWMIATPNNPDKIFVGTEEGLYLTNDGFSTVSKIADGSISDIKFKPGSPNTIYYVDKESGKFFKSTNGGTSFSENEDFGGSAYMRIMITELNPDKVYVTHSNEIHQSIDSGNSFPTNINASSISLNSGIAMISPVNEDEIFLGFFDLHEYIESNSQFTQITNWLGNNNLPLIHVDQRNAFINPLESGQVYICNDGGVYKLDANNKEFTSLSNGLIITQFFDIATAQSDPIVMSGGSQDNGNVFRESNSQWQMAAPTADGMMQAINPNDANIRYNAIQNGAIFRYDNGVGISISQNIPDNQSGNGEWVTPFILDPNDPNRIITAYNKVYESTDEGSTWQAISPNLAGGSDLDYLAIAPSNSNRIYAIENLGQGTGAMFGSGQTVSNIYVKNTTDNNWNSKILPVSEQVQEMAVDILDENTIYIVMSGYVAGEKVFKSTDAGDTWQNISGSLPNVPVTAIEMYDAISGAIFIGTDAGIYYIDDTLTDWEEYGNFPNTYITDIEIQSTNKLLRVGTHGRGVLQAPLPDNECLSANPPDSDADGICDAFDICSGGDDNEDSDNDGVPDFCENILLDYCTALGGTNTGSDYINYVNLNTLTQSSGQEYYADFTNLSTNLNTGESYVLTIGLNYAFDLDTAYAWIDFNQNQLFENDEAITMSDFDNNSFSEGGFTVPLDAISGTTIMRVRNSYNASSDPCNTYAGEVEDYTINVEANSVSIDLKAYLKGAYNSTSSLMNDALRMDGLLPIQEPYSSHPSFNHNGSEETTQTVLDQTGPDAIVDWVLVELRSKYNPEIILSTRATLIQRDGDIVEIDGLSPISFEAPLDEYYVALRHRNHLGIMTDQTVDLSTTTMIDFTDPTQISTWGEHAQFAFDTNTMLMWSGNSNSDGDVIMQGADNDTNTIFFEVLQALSNTTNQANFIYQGYFNSDVNMDGRVVFQGVNNDPNTIFFNVLTFPNNSGLSSNYIINEQLP